LLLCDFHAIFIKSSLDSQAAMIWGRQTGSISSLSRPVHQVFIVS
jgi:hypothetical protein